MKPTVYVVAVNPDDLASTFVRAHVERLPARVVPVCGFMPSVNGTPALSEFVVARTARKVDRMIRRRAWEYEVTRAYLTIFRRGPGVVLAEFGPTGVRVAEACRLAGLPLVVHFHGYDASVRAVIDEHRDAYRRTFRDAAAVVAVSRAMEAKLASLGAPRETLHYNPYGVDCERFKTADVLQSDPIVLSVGRFVDKKAPHLTILAFADAARMHPAAKLVMIGEGPLRTACQDLVLALGLQHAVTFTGDQPHDVVSRHMRTVRCFVQHSVEAQNGDCEGTPNAILEAGASALPVVSTRHAGIPDVVIDGETGWLVAERDVRGMGERLSTVLADAALAARVGRAARHRIEKHFSMEDRIGRLWRILEGVGVATPDQPAVYASGQPMRGSLMLPPSR